jgi:outer membrane protein assembly factor BamB
MKTSKIFFTFLFCLTLLLSATGHKKPLWKITLPRESAGSPAVYKQTVIVVAKNGTLNAMDSAGKRIWQQKLPAGCLASPALAQNNDIYVACAYGYLLRFSATGKQIWQISLEQELMATPLLAAETLFTVSGSGQVCRIRQKDGVILKKIELNLPVHSSPIWDSRRQNLLVPVKDYYLLALSQDLQIIWKFKTLGVNYSVPAVTPENEIYLTSMDHHLYKLNAAGQLLWKYKAMGISGYRRKGPGLFRKL